MWLAGNANGFPLCDECVSELHETEIGDDGEEFPEEDRDDLLPDLD
jgi:hypothetical protein